MDTNSYEKFLISQYTIVSNKKEAAQKKMKTDEKITQLT